MLSSIYNIILQQVSKFPERICICYENEACTYFEFSQEILTAKKQLQESGIKQGMHRVYLSGINSIDLITLFFALLDLDADVVLVDPKSTDSEIEKLLETIPANFLLMQEDISSKKESLTEIKIHSFAYKIISTESDYKNTKGAFVTFFSTGSTGEPKAFGFTEEKLARQLTNLTDHLRLNGNDKVLCPVSFTHSHGVMMTLPFLFLGAQVHYLHPKNCKSQQLEYIQQHRITVFTGVPLQYNLILEVPSDKTALSSLRYAFCGSAPMSEHLAVNFVDKFGVRINQAYGVSEIGPICVNLYEEKDASYQSAGKVIRNIEYKIVDEKDIEVERGEEGELLVRADFMTDGYINADNLQLFRNGWMCTQDIVREDAHGNLFILGRKSGFINVAGYKVYPVEVEKVLLSIKGIKDAVVIGEEDKYRSQIIKACVTTFYPVTEEEIREQCEKFLAKYKIPHQIQILDELPTNSIGKVVANKIKRNQ
jgi:long-chain acyl-CoA synthetase